MRCDGVSFMTHDNNKMLRIQSASSSDCMPEKGASAHFVEDLGECRLHAGTSARGQNYNCCRASHLHGGPLSLT